MPATFNDMRVRDIKFPRPLTISLPATFNDTFFRNKIKLFVAFSPVTYADIKVYIWRFSQ